MQLARGRGANEETYFGGWRRADALGLAPHVDAFAAPGARVGAARVERLGLEAVTREVVVAEVDAVAVLWARVGAAHVTRLGLLFVSRCHKAPEAKIRVGRGDAECRHEGGKGGCAGTHDFL